MKLQEKEWFAERSPEIADAPNAAARKCMIRALADDDPKFYRAFLDALRQFEGWSHLMRNSGRYPLCARGDINSSAVFAEGMRNALNERGRVGCVLPTGIATDDTTKFFFQDVVGTKSLVSLFDFENKGVFFPGVHSSYKFCLFTAGSGSQPAADHAEYVFFAHAVEELRDSERRFTLSPDDIALLNPNTRTCPTFRSRSDATLAKAIYRRVPVLVREARDGQPEENPWGIRFSTMFHMSNDSHLFRTREQLEADGWQLVGNVFRKDGMEYLPLYEAKMTQIFNHRAADVAVSDRARQRKAQPSTLGGGELLDPYRCAMPLYWVDQRECDRAIADTWDRRWLLGFANVTSPTNERTMNPVVIPKAGVGNGMPVVLGTHRASDYPVLYANLCAFVFDYAIRQKIGGINLNFFLLNQCPVLSVECLEEKCAWDSSQSVRDWVTLRVTELSPTPLRTSIHSQPTAAGADHHSAGMTTAVSSSAVSWTLRSSTCTCRPTTMAAGAWTAAPTVALVTKRPHNSPSSSVASPHPAMLSPTSLPPSPLSAARMRRSTASTAPRELSLKSTTQCRSLLLPAIPTRLDSVHHLPMDFAVTHYLRRWEDSTCSLRILEPSL